MTLNLTNVASKASLARATLQGAATAASCHDMIHWCPSYLKSFTANAVTVAIIMCSCSTVRNTAAGRISLPQLNTMKKPCIDRRAVTAMLTASHLNYFFMTWVYDIVLFFLCSFSFHFDVVCKLSPHISS